ncbi:hypothetical protein NZK32_09655 [Cyanobium sp. FGCU-52]|nr:hypothetical protein [Cyanobium sp. FGCU52]
MVKRLAGVGQRGKALASRPLGIALLAAVLLHGLGLTYAGLRNSRTARAPETPKAPDDTPELLRFSRRAPEALPLSTIPLPPPSLLPPPPPNLLAPLPQGQGPANRPPTARGSKTRGPSASGARAAGGKPRGAATRLPVARAPIAGSPAAKPAATSPGATTAALPKEMAAARERLEALRTAPATEDKDTAALQALWELASAVEAEGLPEGLELRRMPASKAKELGLAAGEKRSGRTESLLLVAWLEGDQLWLLQAPAVRTETGGAG